MPNDTIERGIKKAAGDVGNVNYEYVTYEGYGPNGRDPFGDDYEGFNPDGIHKLTGSKYNPNGVDINGKNAQGLYSCAEERIYGYDTVPFDKRTGNVSACIYNRI